MKRAIPPALHAEIAQKANENISGAAISAWLKSAHGITVQARAVQRLVKRIERARAPAVAAALEKQAEVLALDAARVLTEQARLATASLPTAFDAAGKLLPMAQWPDELRAALVGIDFDEDGQIRRIRLAPKAPALDALGRHLGIYSEDNAQAGQSFADLVLAAQRQREGKA